MTVVREVENIHLTFEVETIDKTDNRIFLVADACSIRCETRKIAAPAQCAPR
jgi:hypothetical protein